MHKELSRTFSEHREGTAENEDWRDFDATGGKLKWKDLHEKPLSVVMGEAGIGKSIEFELEVDRLNRAGKPAFLIPLNQLVDTESWQRTLADSHTQFLKWKSST